MDDRRRYSSRQDNELTREDIISALFKLEQKNISAPVTEISKLQNPRKISPKSSRPRDFLTESSHPNDYGHLDEPDLISYIQEAAKDILELVDKNHHSKPSQRTRATDTRYTDRYTGTYDEKEDPKERIFHTLERFGESEKKRKNKIAEMMKEKERNELALLQKAPIILAASKKLKIQPIHERVQTVIERKHERINEVKEIVEKTKKKEEIPTFRPDMTPTSLYNQKHPRVRNQSELTDDLYMWYSKKKAIHESAQLVHADKETQDLSFQPTICKKSKEINNKVLPNEAVEERLMRFIERKEAKVQSIAESSVPVFKPVLNKKTHKIAEKIKQKREGGLFLTEQDELTSSYTETKRSPYQSQRSVSPGKRSMSPGKRDRSPIMGDRTPKSKKKGVSGPANVTEIAYTPEVDFLLQRIKDLRV